MYKSVRELVSLAEEKLVPVWRVILESEQDLTSKTEEEVFEELNKRYEIMILSAEAAIKKPRKVKGSFINGLACQQYAYSKEKQGLCGELLNRVMAMALSCSEVNATMGKICAAPTAGSCGILPAVLIGISEEREIPLRKTLEGLLTASGIGAVITRNATVSGAEGGCQAECGVAAAMAAAAAVQMVSEEGAENLSGMIENAVSFSLINIMGLVCDPVAGMVQVPCAQRNASGAVNALVSADFALAGMQSLIPVDEVIEAMYQVGKLLPRELKETSLGGIAATETGKRLSINK